MEVRISEVLERDIERLMESEGFTSADEVIRSALVALRRESEGFWQYVEAENEKAEADIQAGRYRPVSEEFLAELRSLVTRPTA